MKNPFLDRPWLLIIGGYLFGVSAWIAMVLLAVKHQPDDIPTAPPHAEAR